MSFTQDLSYINIYVYWQSVTHASAEITHIRATSRGRDDSNRLEPTAVQTFLGRFYTKYQQEEESDFGKELDKI